MSPQAEYSHKSHSGDTQQDVGHLQTSTALRGGQLGNLDILEFPETHTGIDDYESPWDIESPFLPIEKNIETPCQEAIRT